ncbi:hypothetical protein [Niabella hibiscisoli]|uniref:hypothetical protein n=1 Tax=Niabella hibiscisoli TaxID=1825928 RepID=UPI001F0E4119|nr:hypothetical protein [Niabella hibiscisoli]MCH5720185.1 hypothetical protein [Niabella hibiscisoli]
MTNRSLRTSYLYLALLLLGMAMSCQKTDTPDAEETPIDLSQVALAITPKGTAKGSAYTQQVGAGGGRVQSPDGQITIDIPAGALAANTTIGIQPISNEAPLGAGNGYRLTPEGTSFAKPVTITMKYGQGLQPGLSWITTQKSDGSWLGCRNTVTDETAQTLSVSTTHFSDWVTGKLIDFRLSPEKAVVKTKGQVQLYVNGFAKSKGTAQEDAEGLAPLKPLYPKNTADDDLAPLPQITDLGTLLEQNNHYRLSFKQWRLSPASGSLKASGSKAVYTAPDKVPNPNTVTVSVDIEATNAGRTTKLILLSTITITDKYFARFTVDGVTSTFTEGEIIKPGAPVQSTGNAAMIFVDDAGELGITFTHGGDQKTMTINTDRPQVGTLPFATTAAPQGHVYAVYMKTTGLDSYNCVDDELLKDGNSCKSGRSSTGALTLTEYTNENGGSCPAASVAPSGTGEM